METVYNQLRLGLNIRMRRHLMKLTQVQLAEMVGCSKGTISALERGQRAISVEMLFALSRALKYPVREMLIGVD